MIPQSFIEEIQTRTDIVELISSYIPLKKMGRNFKALCPFHNEKTPSFVVSPDKQIYHCFGCQEGGGALQFLMLYEKVNFPEAVEILARRLGLAIPCQKDEKSKIKSTLYDAVYEASLFFHSKLLEDKNTLGPSAYLASRSINSETIKKFRLGYAPGRNTILEYLRKKGFTLDVLEKASLVVAKEEGYRDLFCDRIMFPIFDVRSKVLGFGARLWRERNDAPKYINSFEGALYSKREHLFGLAFAKDDIARSDSVIVVEGYLDMITPFASGVCNIVASLGTALTTEQIRLLKRYTSNIILIFDADKAGELATVRSVDLLLENDMDVKVVTACEAKDPDAIIRQKGKDYFLELISKRVDFFDYKISILKKTYDIGSIEGKTKIAQEVLFTINKLKSEVAKYEYIKRLSSVLDVKEEVLIADLRKISPARAALRETAGIMPTSILRQPLSLTEKIILKFMLTNSKAFSLIKKNLKEDDFTSGTSKRVISYFFKSVPKEESFLSSKFLGTIADKEISSIVTEVLMDEEIPQDKEMFKSSVLKLLKNRAKNTKNKIREEIKQAEQMGDREKLKVLVGKYDKVTSELKND